MGTSKILIDGVGIDLTSDTVAANKMLSGTKAHDSNGDSITGDITSKAAATYTPTTTDQTIAAGQYISGAQTVKGDANLIAGNIRSGKSIFGVAGILTPGITPSGTKNITANGTYDVTEFARAAVNVQADYYRRWTYTSTGTASKVSTTLVSGDPWIAAHYNDSDLVVAIRPLFVPQPGEGLRSIFSAIGSNSAMCYGYRQVGGSSLKNLYGFYARFTADSGATSGYTRDKKLTELNDIGDIGVDAVGNIMLCTMQGVTYMLPLGDWDITAYLMR